MIRFRPARPDDINPCVKFVADHPVLGRRYGSTIERLGGVWGGFLGSDALFSIVSEEVDSGGASSLICAQVASFITDDFAAELTTPPLKWIGPALVNRCLHGPAPVMTDAEVRQANSTTGLNILVWPTGPRPGFDNLPELFRESQVIFFDAYRGFNIKRLQTQATHPVEVRMAVNSGGWYLRDLASTASQGFEESPEFISLQPHMLEVTREKAAAQPGTWANTFFAYRKPVIGFARSEQRLLSAALEGGTDRELSDLLGVSLSTVKKMWASVYLRIQTHEQIDIGIELGESMDGDRGKDKEAKTAGLSPSPSGRTQAALVQAAAKQFQGLRYSARPPLVPIPTGGHSIPVLA
jgi:DNA-binding NarL/FixJ family response regulator